MALLIFEILNIIWLIFVIINVYKYYAYHINDCLVIGDDNIKIISKGFKGEISKVISLHDVVNVRLTPLILRIKVKTQKEDVLIFVLENAHIAKELIIKNRDSGAVEKV